MEEFWLRIHRLLGQRSQKWLAEKIDVPQTTLNNWATKRASPPVDKAYAMAEALNTSLDFLYAGSRTFPFEHAVPEDRKPFLEYLLSCSDSQFHRIEGGARQTFKIKLEQSESRAAESAKPSDYKRTKT